MNQQNGFPGKNLTASFRNLWLWALLALLIQLSTSYEIEAHPKPHPKPNQTTSSTLTKGNAVSGTLSASATEPSMPPPINDIPTAHSAVVHFPLVFLLIAAVFQLIAVLRPRRGLNWQVTGLTLGGFIGAYVASSFAHPHTTGLSDSAMHTLAHHEQLAQYTVWLAGGALLLKAISLWRSYRWLEAVTGLVLVASVYYVMHASHMGGELLYRYGVGPRGAYLEQHDSGHDEDDHHEHKH